MRWLPLVRGVLAQAAVGIAALVGARASAQESGDRQTEPSAAAPVRTAVTDLPCIEAPAAGQVVRVVDAAKAPVAGAIVTWFARPDERGNWYELAPEPELSRLRREHGTSVRTGPDGTTRIGKTWCVVASEGDRFAADEQLWRVGGRGGRRSTNGQT